MTANHMVDITTLAVMSEQFSLRLMQLGFRLMQMMDEAKHDQYVFIVPPVRTVLTGPFVDGSDPEFEPQTFTLMPTFQIATYPVTVAEYACAVTAGMVDEPHPDLDLSWQQQQQHPDHPVVGLTWHQAIAYAAFLARVTGQPWRLLLHEEWQKAAQGMDGRVYPWGDSWDGARANIEGSGPGTTTPIGMYADKGDASPYGVHDLAGNVWEWTSTIAHEYYRGGGGPIMGEPIFRVFCGGSYDSSTWDARVAHYEEWKPHSFSNSLGMRLGLSKARPNVKNVFSTLGKIHIVSSRSMQKGTRPHD